MTILGSISNTYNKLKTGTVAAVNSIKAGTKNYVHLIGTSIINAEHIVAKNSLKYVGDVTTWTNHLG